MNVIKFNNTKEYEVSGYSKNTNINNNEKNSDANCTLITNDTSSVLELAEEPITSIKIYSSDNLIYELSEINANINQINEFLNGTHMEVNLYMTFSNI